MKITNEERMIAAAELIERYERDMKALEANIDRYNKWIAERNKELARMRRDGRRGSDEYKIKIHERDKMYRDRAFFRDLLSARMWKWLNIAVTM